MGVRYEPKDAPFMTPVMVGGGMAATVMGEANKIANQARSIAPRHPRDDYHYADNITTEFVYGRKFSGGPRVVARVRAASYYALQVELDHGPMVRAMGAS